MKRSVSKQKASLVGPLEDKQYLNGLFYLVFFARLLDFAEDTDA